MTADWIAVEPLGQIHGHLGATKAVAGIPSSNPYAVDTFGYGDTTKAASEWLLVLMRVVQCARSNNLTIRCQHLPCVGIVVPAGVIVSNGGLKPVRPVAESVNLCVDDIGLSSGDEAWQYHRNGDQPHVSCQHANLRNGAWG